ncbi:MAG: hypothetical protein O2819_04755 [Planctomycetota bacterium]|nr:hypothetical protein [Planctomycetota bacterium]MDA1105146.1 hypothetical protein [Planctomycetota bacterium]
MSDINRHDCAETPYSHGIPVPTAGPMTAALGVGLLFAGLLTNITLTFVGAVLAIIGLVIWFKACFPNEQLEEFKAAGGMVPVVPIQTPPATNESRRRRSYPEAVHPIRAGVRGGLLGGAAMAAVAVAWGIAEHGSPWMPINLLVGVVTPSMADSSLGTLMAFDGSFLIDAIVIHTVMSVLVGMLFTIALAMMPSRPMLMGAIIVPATLTCLTWPILGIVNPALEEFISWPWFIASEVAFGVACGWFVNRAAKICTLTGLPVTERLEIERGRESGR